MDEIEESIKGQMNKVCGVIFHLCLIYYKVLYSSPWDVIPGRLNGFISLELSVQLLRRVQQEIFIIITYMFNMPHRHF